MYLSGFSAMLLIILWLFQISFLDVFYRNTKIAEVEKSSREIAEEIRGIQGTVSAIKPEISEYIEALAQEKDICIEVSTPQGEILYTSHQIKDCIIHRLSPQSRWNIYVNTFKNEGKLMEYYKRDSIAPQSDRNQLEADPLEGGKPPEKRDRPFADNIIYSNIVSGEDGESVMILASTIIVPVDATVSTLRTQLYFITIIMIISSMILAFVIARRVSKPIENLNVSARILSGGNYDVEFDEGGYREIKELSQTLSHTAAELAKVEGLRREIIANVSHDLRTPLTLIGGYAEVMRDIPGENNAENAQIIIEETQRLSTMVSDLLEISKLEKGQQSVNYKNYNFTQSIQSMIDTTRELLRLEEYNIAFYYNEEVNVEADEIKMSQAFYNLLINAINYTGEDQKIVIKQILDGDTVKIEVIDTGEGIEMENLPYIWDRYYKVDKVHKRALKGTGLGLSIVKSIVEMHKGNFGVESELGRGSTFWFQIPVSKAVN